MEKGFTMRKRLLAAAVAAVAVTAGVTSVLAMNAGAATGQSYTLVASAGATAVLNSSGDPVLTVGGAGTTAAIEINNPAPTPSVAPTFTTVGFSNDSPRWQLEFADGGELVGYPSQLDSAWQVLPASSGTCANAAPSTDNTYTLALAFLNGEGCGGTVATAEIVASGTLAPSTSDTITSFNYNGLTLGSTSDVVTVTNPGAQTSTVGTGIATLQLAAASSLGDNITGWAASGLPAGLTINTTTGAISGTPSTAGTYSVTGTATDSANTEGSAAFTWTVNASSSTAPTGTTYTGNIRLIKMNYCLDDQYNSSSSGAIVQIWRCNGLQNQVWYINSDGTIQHNGLCLDAMNSGTTDGTKLQLATCSGGNNQLWSTSSWRIHYDNPAASNMVVDDRAFGGSGTQQELWTNNGGRNQVWGTF
jgi:hypothetical protein